MSKKLKVSGTGDALYVAAMPREYDADMAELRAFMDTCDVRITNFESNIEEFGDYAAAESGGTWINTPPSDFDDLTRFGFNYYGTANNHAGDFTMRGMLSTIDYMDRLGLAHSGSGRSLEEAGAPAVLDIDGKKVAIIAFTMSFKPAMKAGNPSEAMKARPGINYLTVQRAYSITKEQADQLLEIAKTARINEERQAYINTGYQLPDPEGIVSLGELKFCYDGSYPTSYCNKKDLARIVASIKDAKEKYDYVLVVSHSHTNVGGDFEEVPPALIEACHAFIDAGASAIFGSGTHQLRPMEVYNGAPIFYSLGDFIYQGMRVHYLPADFMEKYGIHPMSTAWEGLMARSQGGKLGLQADECNFLTVLPRLSFDDNGDLAEIDMLPISLGFHREGYLNGLPYHAKGEEGKKIFDILNRLSKPYGTELVYENDKIIWKK